VAGTVAALPVILCEMNPERFKFFPTVRPPTKLTAVSLVLETWRNLLAVRPPAEVIAPSAVEVRAMLEKEGVAEMETRLFAFMESGEAAVRLIRSSGKLLSVLLIDYDIY